MDGAVTALLDNWGGFTSTRDDVRRANLPSGGTHYRVNKRACTGSTEDCDMRLSTSSDLISACCQAVRRVCLPKHKLWHLSLTAPSQPYPASTCGSPIALDANDCSNRSNARLFALHSARIDRKSPAMSAQHSPAYGEG